MACFQAGQPADPLFGILTIEPTCDNKELEELSRGHAVVAVNTENVVGGKMILTVFLGLIITFAVALGCMAFVVHVVSKI